MLSLLRRFSKSPVGLGIFALILIAFIVTLYEGRSGLGGMSLAGGSGVVQVGSSSIDEAELTRRVQNQLEGARQQTPTLGMAQFVAAGGVERTIELTATGRALEIFAEQQGMVASKKLIDGAIASIPAFHGPTGNFDPTTFQQVLSQRKLSEKMLRDDFAREALTKALAIPVAGAARVPAGLVQPYAALLLEAREGHIAEVPSRAFVPAAAPSDAEIQGFYQQNLVRYTIPERRVIRYATFDKTKVADKAQATDAEIQAVYTAQAADYGAREKRSFTQLIVPTEAQANELVAKIKGGTPMADAGKSVQRDALTVPATDSAAFAKLTGPDVAAAAFATPKGEIAAVKRSGLGFHIVRVDSIQTIAATPLSAVRTKLGAEIAAQKETRAIADFVAQIEDSASSGATFDELVTKFGLTAEASPPLTKAGATDTPGYVAPPAVGAVVSAAFQAESGDDPAVTALPQNVAYVLWKLDRTVPAAPKPLAQLREQVIADVQNDKGLRAAKAAADAIVAAVNRGEALDAAMKVVQVRLPAPSPARATRLQLAQAQGPVPPPLTTLFALPERRARAMQMPENGGWYVVFVDKVTPGDIRSAPPGLVEATQRQLSGAVGDEYVQQFAAAIRAQVGVSTNPAAVAQLKRTLAGSGTQ